MSLVIVSCRRMFIQALRKGADTLLGESTAPPVVYSHAASFDEVVAAGRTILIDTACDGLSMTHLQRSVLLMRYAVEKERRVICSGPRNQAIARELFVHGAYAYLTIGEVLEVPDTSFAATGHRLSIREIQVLYLVARGMTNQEVGEELSLALNTVKTHLDRIAKKLNAEGPNVRTACVLAALRQGIIN